MAHRVSSGLRLRGSARPSFGLVVSAGLAVTLLAACSSTPDAAVTTTATPPTLPASAATTPTQVAAASTPCSPSRDDAALAVRTLQSHLMVAGLSCGQADAYNRFVGRFQTDLVNHGKSLTGYFNREYGGRGSNQMNAYVTRMANEASTRHMGDPQGFCGQSQAVFDALNAVGPGALVDYIVAQHPFMPQGLACATSTADSTPLPTKATKAKKTTPAKAPAKKK